MAGAVCLGPAPAILRQAFVRLLKFSERQAATGTTGKRPWIFAARQAAVTPQFYEDPA